MKPTAEQQDHLAELEAYWQRLRGARLLPARTEVDPARVDRALPWSVVVERIGPGVGRIRVAGQQISQLAGGEARGLPLCSLFRGSAKDRIMGFLEQAFSLPAVVQVPLITRRGLVRGPASGSLLILPLSDGAGQATRAIAAFSLDRGPQVTPLSFEIDDERTARLQRLSELAAPRVPHQSERPWLRLVVANA